VSLPAIPQLPPVLVSREHAADLQALVDRFVSPSGILIECPLGEETQGADLSLSFPRPQGKDDTRIITRGWPADTAWQRVRHFIDAWSEPTGTLWEEVRSLWLEFDLRRGGDAPLPNTFFGRSVGVRSRLALETGLDLLLAQPGGSAGALPRGGDGVLPPNANVLFLGVMLAREPAAIRLCVDGPPWQAAPIELSELTRHVIVQIEASGPGVNRVGFELYQGRRQRGQAGVWRPLLDWLIEIGVARADRCAAALAWSGYGAGTGQVVARWINHVKVTCENGVVTEAKVYLQFATAWEPSSSDIRGLGR
jgi:hypothetical protein